jgi:MFS family permease
MQRPNKIQGIISYIIAATFLLYEMAVQTSPSIMTTQLMHDLSIDAFTIGIISASYFISYSLMQIPVGLILDRLSIRLNLTLAIITCAIGSFMFAHGDSVLMLCLARLLMGFGSAFAFVSVLAIAHHWFSGRIFALLVGLAQLLAAFGAWAGEYPLKNYMLHHANWRSSMVMLGVIGLFLGLFALLFIGKQQQSTTPKPTVKKSLKVIFSNTQTFWIALYAFCSWSPIIIFAELWGVPFLTQEFHISTEASAAYISTVWLALALLSPILGYLSNRFNRRCIFLQITAAIGLIGILALLFIPITAPWFIIVTLSGIGIAAAGQILTFAVVRDINQHNITATAIAFNNLAVVAGGLLLHPVVGYLLKLFGNGMGSHGAITYSVKDYHIAFLFIPICYITGILVSRYKIKETFCLDQEVQT